MTLIEGNLWRSLLRIGLALQVLGAGTACAVRGAEVSTDLMHLDGAWRIRLDPNDVGRDERWFEGRLGEQTARLPGSLQEQGFGNDVTVETEWIGGINDRSWFTSPRYAKYREPGQVKIPFWLQPEKHYVGPAWFQRDVAVPDHWRDKRIVLSLERCHWETTVWVDGERVGSADSLSTPHRYDLTRHLVPGAQRLGVGRRTSSPFRKGTVPSSLRENRGRPQVVSGVHRLSIRVDNRLAVNVGPNSHSVTDHTQSAWNGIAGRIELRAADRVWIEDVQVFPDAAHRSARIKVAINDSVGESGSGTLTLDAIAFNTEIPHDPPARRVPVEIGPEAVVEVDYPMGDDAQLWDEFQPSLYRLAVRLDAATGAARHRHEVTTTFGMRNIATEGTQFILNGRPVFLRGTLECCIFPLTGYPPTDVGSWKRIIRVCKAHGLNHMRFHSWCPPQAAFVAADELGFYFHVECAAWANQGAAVGEGKPIDRWLYAEADRILKEYGNHPSFLLMAYGNEPAGPGRGAKYLGPWVNHFKDEDGRRLYTSGAGWPIIPESQYHSTPRPRIHQWGEGLGSRINAREPETVTDYRDFVAGYEVPVVSHEIGQWCVYPNFDEAAKYTGVLKPKNFEVFGDFLRANHMGDQACDFLMASGKLQVICYKEEIESALRTPGFGGFQLLDLHDFPGQGTALVGVLDPFWDSKPYVTPEQYRRFCGHTVPLARLPKRTFVVGETMSAAVEVYHFGPADLEEAVVAWKLLSEPDGPLASGRFPAGTIAAGRLNEIGRLDVALDEPAKAQKLRLVVGIEDTPLENDWDLWVYPSRVDTPEPPGVLIADQLSEQAVAELRAGGKVLLMLPSKTVRGDVAIGFSPVFWNTAWTRNQAPHTLGILCDPQHPALAEFPTEYHTNWQWWELISRSAAMVLDELPPQLRPIVQVIDTWFEARRLGLIFEANVAGGKLLVCSIDLQHDLQGRPVARQMRHSLLEYMAGGQFDPRVEVSVEAIRRLVRSPSRMERLGATVTADSETDGYPAAHALDGNRATIWHTPWGDQQTKFPHYLVIDLNKRTNVTGLNYVPRQDMANGRIAKFAIYVSGDGADWTGPVTTGTWPNTSRVQRVRLEAPQPARYVKLVAESEVNGNIWASAAEVEVLTQ